MCLYYHLTYLTYVQSTLYETPSLMKHKLESRLLGEISVISSMQMTPPFKKHKGTKEPLDESERGEQKSWLKTQHSKKLRSWHPTQHLMVNRWGNNGTSERLYFLELQNHCRW